MNPDYGYGFLNPMAEPHKPLRPEWDTFGASKRPRHGGLDLYPVRLPAKIIVTADGKTRFSGMGSSQAGWLAEILHPGDPGWYLTRSMHMASPPSLPAKGTPVRAGDFVGYAGATGNAKGVHNHFEIRYTPNPEADEWRMYGSGWGVRYDPALFGILKNGGSVDDDAVRGLQRIAAGKGFDPGPIDGVWGTRTEDAWERMMEAALVSAGGGFTYETVEVVRTIDLGG